jgi:hypothetical protein
MRTSIHSLTASWTGRAAIVFLISALLGAVAAISSVGAPLLVGPLGAVVIWAVFVRPYWAVLFLTIFMPFENVVLKFMPVPNQLYVASRFFSESLIYLAIACVVLRKLGRGRDFRRTPIDVPVVALLAIMVLSILVNRPPLLGSLVNLRSQLRYLVLFYLAANLDITPRQVRNLLRGVVAISVFQVLLGALQLTAASQINPILLPRQADIEVAGFSRGFRLLQDSREIGSIFGTLGDTVFFALFMLVALAVHLGYARRVNIGSIAFALLTLLAISFAFARAVVFAALLMLVIFLATKYGLRSLLRVGLFILPILLVGLLFLVGSTRMRSEFVNPRREKVGIVKNITGVFTVEYFKRAQRQRLGALIGVPPTVAFSRPVLGYGPNEDWTIEQLNNSRPSFLLGTVVKAGFEDVYWVALLSYYGFAGLIVMLLLFCRLYYYALKMYRACSQHVVRGLALAVVCVVGVAPFLLFFYRVLEFRSFSFYFWLLAGVLVGVSRGREHLRCI